MNVPPNVSPGQVFAVTIPVLATAVAAVPASYATAQSPAPVYASAVYAPSQPEYSFAQATVVR